MSLASVHITAKKPRVGTKKGLNQVLGRRRRRALRKELEEEAAQRTMASEKEVCDHLQTAYTRVFVSGLPPKCEAEWLRAHFGMVGEVTDVTLPISKKMSTKNGNPRFCQSRGIGFVGFRETAQARLAVEKLNRSFLRTSRLTVRPAEGKGNLSKLESEQLSKEGAVRKRKAGEHKRGSERCKKTKINDSAEGMAPGCKQANPRTEKDADDGTKAAFDESLDDMAYLKTKRYVNESEEAEAVEDSPRLLVSNFASSAGEDELLRYFSTFGMVSEVHIPLDHRTKASKGIAFVRFVLVESATAALEGADGAALHGKLLRVRRVADTPDDHWSSRKKPRTFSERREAERQKRALAEASTGLAGHVREDAVTAVAAKRLDTSKAALFDARQSGETAVALALAESSLQLETANFFKERGFDLASSRQSRTAILVKNLPAQVTEAELRSLFESKGHVAQVFLPPSGASAIVCFEHAADARIALKRLAYRRFKHMPLYLDWAPDGEPIDIKSSNDKPIESKPTELSVDDEDDDKLPSVSTTVYIKNLNFKTTAEALKERLASLNPRSISLPLDERRRRNKGYGFVEFDTLQDARLAAEAISGQSLDAHRLQAFLSGASKNTELSSQKSSSGKGNKLVVRNVAFAATVNDLRQLFAAFGELQNVRLPKRFDGRHRGFAFVKFAAKRDAASAVEALKHAHFYGRHLVIDYADEAAEDEVDEEK